MNFKSSQSRGACHPLERWAKCTSAAKIVYEQWQQVRQKLLLLDRDIFEESIEDIEDQLDDLSLSDFVYRMSYQIAAQYPRYLQALLVRRIGLSTIWMLNAVSA